MGGQFGKSPYVLPRQRDGPAALIAEGDGGARRGFYRVRPVGERVGQRVRSQPVADGVLRHTHCLRRRHVLGVGQHAQIVPAKVAAKVVIQIVL